MPIPAFGVIDPRNVQYYAGVRPVLANVDENTIDPFDVSVAGGDSFDLVWLSSDPLVQSGAVNLNKIRYVRLVDIIGNGNTLDSFDRPIYDPTGIGVGGAPGGNFDDECARTALDKIKDRMK